MPQLIENGRVQTSGRAWLGVDLRTMAGGGTLIADVVPNGPAAKARIRAGELLVSVAGSPGTTVDDIAVALAEQRPGARIPVQLRDRRGTHTVNVTLGQIPAGD